MIIDIHCNYPEVQYKNEVYKDFNIFTVDVNC